MHHVVVSDEGLAAGIAAGDAEALEYLVEHYHPSILRYLWRTGGSKEDAEDLAMQSLLRIRKDILSFKGRGTFRAWTFQVAYRELLTLRRRQSIARLLAPKTRERVEAPDPDAIVIAEALARLPMPLRAAFLLTKVEGLSVEEAAQALGVPVGTVKSRCHLARKRLQGLLGSTYGEPNAEPITD